MSESIPLNVPVVSDIPMTVETDGEIPIHEVSVNSIIKAISPVVAFERTEDGAVIEVTDIEGPKTVNVYDGQDGADGADGADGQDGADGISPVFSIGTVTTGEPGSDASVTITGTDAEPVLNMTIPRGNTGRRNTR